MTDTVPLRDHIDRLLEASQREVDLQRENMETRLELSNGLIEQMRQQAHDMVRKVELAAVVERVHRLETEQSRIAGTRTGHQPLVNIAMVIIAAIVAAIVARYA